MKIWPSSIFSCFFENLTKFNFFNFFDQVQFAKTWTMLKPFFNFTKFKLIFFENLTKFKFLIFFCWKFDQVKFFQLFLKIWPSSIFSCFFLNLTKLNFFNFFLNLTKFKFLIFFLKILLSYFWKYDEVKFFKLFLKNFTNFNFFQLFLKIWWN